MSKQGHCWGLDAHDVSNELLEEMGVTILEDDSDSMPSVINSDKKRVGFPVSGNEPAAKIMKMDVETLTPPDEEDDEDFYLYKRKRPEGMPDRNSFSKLSDEIVLQIFKWLPKATLAKCALVCKWWRRVSYDEVLWKRLDLGGRSLGPTVLGTVLGRGTTTLRLAKAHINDPLFPSDAPFPVDLRACYENLKFLDLSMATISVDGLHELLHSCCNLRKLSLEHCTLTDEICRCIAQNSNIEVLNMAMCEGLTESGIREILTNCRKLQSCNLAWTDLSSSALDVVVSTVTSHLERLNISGCRFTLKNEHIAELCEKCPGLIELDISDATVITSAIIEVIVDKLNKLEYLAMSRCYAVPLAAYVVFRNSNLLYLDIFGVATEAALATLREQLSGIQINKFMFSSLARPTVGIRRTSIWELRVRD